MWIQIILNFLIVIGFLLAISVIYSFIRTAGGTRYDLSFYEKDRCHQPGVMVKRRYKSAGHLLHRLLDTLQYSYPIFRVYILRALSAKFREKIMLTAAITNQCER